VLVVVCRVLQVPVPQSTMVFLLVVCLVLGVVVLCRLLLVHQVQVVVRGLPVAVVAVAVGCVLHLLCPQLLLLLVVVVVVRLVWVQVWVLFLVGVLPVLVLAWVLVWVRGCLPPAVPVPVPVLVWGLVLPGLYLVLLRLLVVVLVVRVVRVLVQAVVSCLGGWHLQEAGRRNPGILKPCCPSWSKTPTRGPSSGMHHPWSPAPSEPGQSLGTRHQGRAPRVDALMAMVYKNSATNCFRWNYFVLPCVGHSESHKAWQYDK